MSCSLFWLTQLTSVPSPRQCSIAGTTGPLWMSSVASAVHFMPCRHRASSRDNEISSTCQFKGRAHCWMTNEGSWGNPQTKIMQGVCGHFQGPGTKESTRQDDPTSSFQFVLSEMNETISSVWLSFFFLLPSLQEHIDIPAIEDNNRKPARARLASVW